MATKQGKLKEQAYASNLKSRALSVLIYLIDRSDQELTCFPAIPTMAEQLHISISTVKRALRELVDAGYISKDARFREKNRGQSSNLYTLILQEEKQEGNKKDGSSDREKMELASDNSCDDKNKDGKDNQDMGKVERVLEKGKVEYIDFDGMAGKKGKREENVSKNCLSEALEVTLKQGEISNVQGKLDDSVPDQYVYRECDCKLGISPDRQKWSRDITNIRFSVLLWTGEEVNLNPP